MTDFKNAEKDFFFLFFSLPEIIVHGFNTLHAMNEI
jgi:hypothetical protein